MVNSGTDKEIYDVYVHSEQLAIASGEDVVLLWNGDDWQTILTSDTSTIYSGVWITPEQEYAYYQSVGSPFSVLCPYEIGAINQGFCRANFSPMLTMCGERDDLKVFMANGDILHFDNQLGAYDGINDELHDQTNPLSLTGIYIPEDSCLPGPIKPLEIYAINNANDFYYFDGDQWNDMGVNIPNGQTLTWLNGSSRNNIVATGFKPNQNNGNDGVIWTFDGTAWAEDSNLPKGTPGLTDIAVNIGYTDNIFLSGFEASTRNLSDDTKVNILAAAEKGKYLSTADLFPSSVTELRVSKRLLTQAPIRLGDRIVFQIVIQNISTINAVDFRFLDGYLNNIQIVNDNCGMTEFNRQAGWHYRDVRIPLLGAGDAYSCTMEFDVIGPVGEKIRNYAAIAELDEKNYRNNRSSITGPEIMPPE